MAVGCPSCAGTGYQGRTVLAEMLSLDGAHAGPSDPRSNRRRHARAIGHRSGMVDRWQRAMRAIEAGITSPAEVRRVLGFSKNKPEHAGY